MRAKGLWFSTGPQQLQWGSLGAPEGLLPRDVTAEAGKTVETLQSRVQEAAVSNVRQPGVGKRIQ